MSGGRLAEPGHIDAGWPLLVVMIMLGMLAQAAAAAGPVDAVTCDQAASRPFCYERQPTLEETLRATRERYQGWAERQARAAQGVTMGPWRQASPGLAAGKDQALVAPTPAQLEEKDRAGQPLWPAQGWKDGTFVLAAPCRQGPKTALLTRTLEVAQPVRLTVGLGGGEQMEVWLNGQRVWAGATAIPIDRYGTGMIPEGTHADQAIVDLDLPAGRSSLVVRLVIERDQQFWFTPRPNPVPAIWRQVRKDFPQADNPLLELAEAEWFDVPGWLEAREGKLEQRLLARLVEEAGGAGATLKAEQAALAAAGTPPGDARWLALCIRAADAAEAARAERRVGAAIRELHRQFPQAYAGGEFLKRLEGLALSAGSEPPGASPADRYAAASRRRADLALLRREALLTSNPLLRGRRILFVKRITYNSQHYYDDYYHGVREFGGGLCELSLDTGQVRDVLPQLAGGIFDRFDLSFDGKRVVFGYRPPRSGGFRIYEANLDGTGLRQLTFPPDDETQRIARYCMYPLGELERKPTLYGHWTDDMHPCYLSDGGIALVSSRCERSVLCGGHSLTTTCLYRMNADGSGLQPLSAGSLSEFTPTMLADGRILYNRWEYVYKGIAAIQPLWAMRPDGSASEEVYGDNITDPGVFVQARQVPGHDNLIVCTGCGHEPLAVGSILLLNLHHDKRTVEPMTSLTPDTTVRNLRGLHQCRNGRWREDVYGPFHCDPYPLSDKFFLISCNPDRRYNDRTAYAIALLDAFGNRIEVHRDPQFSCFQPMLAGSRPVPPVLAAGQSEVPAGPALAAAGVGSSPAPGPAGKDEAAVVLADVYQGLGGVPRGSVKYIRVLEQIPRPWSAWQGRGDDGIGGQMVAVSWYTHIWIAVLHGLAPVEADGSAHFIVPTRRNLYFQALDENYMEVQRMRTFVNFQPGERRSCVGCHEPRSKAPPPASVLAARMPPRRLAPQPGEPAPRPLHYPSDVQPVFDRHCVRCHSGDKPKAGIDLTAAPTTHFSKSYESLMTRNMVSAIQEWILPPGVHRGGWGASMEHAAPLPPYGVGSHKSRLIAHLRKGHSNVTLSPQEWVRLVTWVDTNAQYYGSYFGRRHIRYQGARDFRPVPTLESACGVEPVRPRPQEAPARLIARWTFDEPAGPVAVDACGNAHPGKVVGAERVPGATGAGQALRLIGLGHVEAGGLGRGQTVSVALWVKAERLEHTWNPLLFTDGWQESSFHFSLLPGGRLNLAVNGGKGRDLHNASYAGVGDGRWHHVAVVCDGRPDGVVRFYVDGRRDRQEVLDAGVPLNLDAFRIGAYNLWQGQARCNFHGSLDDVRVYSGMLTDKEVLEIHEEPRNR